MRANARTERILDPEGQGLRRPGKVQLRPDRDDAVRRFLLAGRCRRVVPNPSGCSRHTRSKPYPNAAIGRNPGGIPNSRFRIRDSGFEIEKSFPWESRIRNAGNPRGIRDPEIVPLGISNPESRQPKRDSNPEIVPLGISNLESRIRNPGFPRARAHAAEIVRRKPLTWHERHPLSAGPLKTRPGVVNRSGGKAARVHDHRTGATTPLEGRDVHPRIRRSGTGLPLRKTIE